MKNSEYIGMNLQDWCKLDIEDKRKIHYTFFDEDVVREFTSEEIMPGEVRWRLVNSTIEDIRLENNEWYITSRYVAEEN